MKELQPNAKKSLERMLQNAEWTTHSEDRRDWELTYLKCINKYRREGYNVDLFFTKYDQYIVRVNERKITL